MNERDSRRASVVGAFRRVGLAADAHRAGVRLEISPEHIHESGFARAIFAYEAEDSFREIEAHSFQNFHPEK